MSWLLHRIDDRLIHGQVLVAWGARLHPVRMWLVDDAVAASEWERRVYEEAAPGIEVHVVDVATAAAEHAGEARATGARSCSCVTSGPPAASSRRARPCGSSMSAACTTRRARTRWASTSTSTPRTASTRALLARGVALEVRDVPASRSVPLASLDAAVQP